MAAIDTKINNIKTRVGNRSALKNLVPGTLAGDLIESIAIEISNSEQMANAASDKNSISTAAGYDLDALGDFFGNRRLPAVSPYVTSAMKCLKFYVDTGYTFGSINNNADIIIPAGTFIEGASTVSVYKFVTETDITLPSTANELYFSAKLVSGASDVIPSGSLTIHSFKNYIGYGNDSLKVTNSFIIGTGRKEETDDNYRARLKQSFKVFPKTTIAAITDYINSIPGIAKTVIETPTTSGGSLNIYVQSISPYTSDEVISNIETAVSGFVNPWCTYNILRPNYLGVKATLRLSGNFTNTTTFKKLIIDNISKYINNFSGSVFDVTTLPQIAINLNYGITSGIVTHASYFTGEDVAREETVMDITNGLTSFTIRDTERLVVEPISDAITIEFI